MQNIVNLAVRAIKEFSLIEDGDKIAIAVSGGKDSMVLLECFLIIKKFFNFKIDIMALTADLNFGGFSGNYSEIEKICIENSVRYIVQSTNIADIVFNIRKETNPCSLCSKMRKGILNSLAVENGCNKIAFGHHFDDVVETFIMNLFNEGRIGCFSPKTYLSRKNISLIRPLVFVKESQLASAVARKKIPVVKTACPVDGKTNREVIKQFLALKEKTDCGFKERIFCAIRKAGIAGWGF